MMKKILLLSVLFAMCVYGQTIKAQTSVDVEYGLVYTGHNDIRIPGKGGTFFSLTKNGMKTDAQQFYRIRLNHTINSHHTLSLLYAPLETTSEGAIDTPIQFRNVLFPGGTPITTYYRFNSYRLTYRYEIINNAKLMLGIGATAKIRDARIRLVSGNTIVEKSNIGFVPILNFRLWWNFYKDFGLLFEGDALAAPQGRAEDVQLAATYRLSDKVNLRAGYRILEGGADNDEVYNFSLLHYASIGLTYHF